MIQVFYALFTEKMPTERFSQLFALLTPEMQEQVLRFRHWEDAQRSVIGKALLLEGLKQFNLDQTSLSNLKFTDFQKPYFENDIHFNISHSGNCIVCAIGTIEVGVDIEAVKEIPLNDFTELFSTEELKLIYRQPGNYTAFYNLWTQKEAFLKALGVGLNMPLNQIVINKNKIEYNGSTWFLRKTVIHEGYICHVVTPLADLQIQLKQVHF